MTEIVVPFIVIVVPLMVMASIPLGLRWMSIRQKVTMKELDIRELEAKARLMEAEARAALPEYVDARDPESVAAYKRARDEVNSREKAL